TPGDRRSVGEVVAQPDPRFGTQPLTGFENHLGVSTVGPGSLPLGQVERGNAHGDRTEAALSWRARATYLHGQVLRRDPAVAVRAPALGGGFLPAATGRGGRGRAAARTADTASGAIAV